MGRKAAVQVGLAEPVKLGVQLRRHRPGHAQRVDLGDHVAADPVIPDQHVDAFLQLRGLHRFAACAQRPASAGGLKMLDARNEGPRGRTAPRCPLSRMKYCRQSDGTCAGSSRY